MTVDLQHFEIERGPIIEVLWVDSSGSHAWSVRREEIEAEARKTAMYVRTVGYVTDEDDDSIMLTESVTGNDRIGCATTIPKFAIVHRRGLMPDATTPAQ